MRHSQVKQSLSFSRATNIVASTGTKVEKSTVINYLKYAENAYLVLPVYNIANKLADKLGNVKTHRFVAGTLGCRLDDFAVIIHPAEHDVHIPASLSDDLLLMLYRIVIL